MPEPSRVEASPSTNRSSHLRRVVIDDGRPQSGTLEDRQRKTIEHARLSRGYADDVDLNAHDQATFRLINMRKALDGLPGAEYIVPKLDDWKHWVKMNDWDSRNKLLEELVSKLRRHEASPAEIQFLVVICRPTWLWVKHSLRRADSAFVDDGEIGARLREETRRVNELDRSELDMLVQHALFDALLDCRPFPRRFYPWLRRTLTFRVLDRARNTLFDDRWLLPEDLEMKDLLDEILAQGNDVRPAAFATPGARQHDMWRRTLDLPAIFDLADEYSPYARTQTACERAVERLAPRQRAVIEGHYFQSLPQTEIAKLHGLADSTVRNTHAAALRKLHGDDQLFGALVELGRVRDRQRRLALDTAERRAA